MCGISGIAGVSPVNCEVLYGMSRSMRHRGPDDEGFLLVDAGSKIQHARGDDTIVGLRNRPHILTFKNSDSVFVAGIVHRRLSIIDLSEHGHQPMSYANGKVYIAFNGEVYNYREIKAELIKHGYTFESDSDTEVILASYIQWGNECVHRFVGMWSFVIYDTEKKMLFISRDRFGIKPLYYHYKKGRLVFASEIKTLLQENSVPKKINGQNLFEYLNFGKISSAEQTLFNNIVELHPGCNIIYSISDDRLSVLQYYNLRENALSVKQSLKGKILFDEYEKTFADSIKLHLRADVPVGTCLSGGLDSSAIVAFAAPQLAGKNFNSFTAIYSDKAIDESYFAKAVSSHFKNISPYYTTPDAEKYWADIDKLIWHQDLPIASTSMYAQWEVMKLASKHGMKVLLDGQGADETLGGYSVFTGVYLFDLLKKFRLGTIIAESRKLKRNRSVNIFNETGRAAFYLLPHVLKKQIRKKQRIGSVFIADDFKMQFADAQDNGMIGGNFFEMSLLSVKYGMHDLLRYEDRNSMAFSIESRVPFLDHRLVELSLAMPDNMKINNGWTKYILRKTADKKIPDEVVWRKDKKGFVTPQKKWMWELKPQLTQFINETTMPSMLKRKEILKALDHPALNAAQVSEFWKTVALIKWFNVFGMNE